MENKQANNHQTDEAASTALADNITEVKRQKSAIFRHYFLYVLIAGLVVSAVISIVAVLVGSFSDFLGRALLTTVLMMIHALVAIAIMSTSSDNRDRANEILANTTLGLTVLSFITSTFATWDVLNGQTTSDLYQIYLYALIASFIIYGLVKAVRSDQATRLASNTAVAVTAVMFVYIIPSAFDDSYPHHLPDIYYRGLAALAILLGTTAVLTIIFHWMYHNKHPELKAKTNKPQAKMPLAAKIAVIILSVFFGLPLLFVLLAIIAALFRM